MNRFRLYLLFLILAFRAFNNVLGSPIPFEKGTRWTYEGKVEWTVAGSSAVKATKIIWTTEIVYSITNAASQAAVARGFPTELAWYEPDRVPGFSVLFSVSNCVYQLSAENEKAAVSLARKLIKDDNLSSGTEQLLVFPLKKGNHWAVESERDDNYYCWNVEEEKKQSLNIKGLAKRRFTIYSVTYRSLPDHQILEVTPGVGITRYVFVHHGTIATADVRLVSFKRSR